MSQQTGIDPITYLVGRRYRGVSRAPPPSLLKGTRDPEALASHNRLVAAVNAYREELATLPKNELAARFEAEWAKEAEELREKARQEEAARFFNLPQANADFDHWSRAEHWTLEEAIALAFGKAPESVSWKTLEPYKLVSPFVVRYARLRDLAQRALSWEKLYDPVLPVIFIDWIQKNELDFPPDLAAKVESRRGRMADWKSAYDRLLEQYNSHIGDWRGIVEKQRDSLKEADSTIAKLRSEALERETTLTELQASAAIPNSQSSVERDSMLKVIYGLAVRGYGYDPTAKRSRVVPEMISDLATQGLKISDDTLRRFKQAYERLHDWREASR